jgi:hypothetical protein
MKNVEQHPGFQWGKSDGKTGQFKVERAGEELRIRALFPDYEQKDPPEDLIRGYELARKRRFVDKKNIAKNSPHVQFANADTDEKLIAFVSRFGPVIAKSTKVGHGERTLTLNAVQDLNELRVEQVVYHAALSLIMELGRKKFNPEVAAGLIAEIATNIKNWPEQLNRGPEGADLLWKLSAASMKRISDLSAWRPNSLLPPTVDARIVISELLNVFPARVFPNPLEMHSAIWFGIRPLLYALLRREFLHGRETEVCANTFCRDCFEMDRAGQIFCSPDCSRQQRQRDYWQDRGNKLRKKRMRAARKQEP